jgi:hypothetical protein
MISGTNRLLWFEQSKILKAVVVVVVAVVSRYPP